MSHHPDIITYNHQLSPESQVIAHTLAEEIYLNLPEAEGRVWHGAPVWFIDGNPIVGYSQQKPGMRLMFWSGADFEEDALNIKGKKFKDASIFYNNPAEISAEDLKRWLQKARHIQWDYKNLIKHKGKLEKIQ